MLKQNDLGFMTKLLTTSTTGLLSLLFCTALPAHAQQENAAQRVPHEWVFNGKGQKTDQIHYADAAVSDILLPISLNNHWGLMNQDGEVIVFPRFDWTDYSYDGAARYVANGKTGYLRGEPAEDDDPREFFIFAQFDYGDRFVDGLAVVMNQGRWGMIDRSGRYLIPMAYDGVLRMQDGFAAVQKNGKCGFVNRAGRIKIPLQYKKVRSFHNGFAAVQFDNGQWGYIDKRNKTVWRDTSGEVLELGDFHETHAKVKVRRPEGPPRWGYITKAFRPSIDPIYEDARDFHNGIAAVKLGGKWGFIGASGRWVIKPRYEEADDFDNAVASNDFDRGKRETPDDRLDNSGRSIATAGLYAMVKENGRWGYINRTGRQVLVPQFKEATPFFRGLARVSRGESFAYVAERGQVRFDPVIALKLGMVNVSSREDARVVAAQKAVSHGGVILGDLDKFQLQGDTSIANVVLLPPPKRVAAKVPYVGEHLYEEVLPAKD